MIKRPDSSALAWRITRIGGVLRSLLMVIFGAVMLAGAAFILEPAALVAVTRPPEPRSYSQSIRDEFALSLSNLMAECVEVLAVHNHSSTSQAAIVLWMQDEHNPGVIDPHEVTIIAHSQLLRTITAYALEATSPPSSALPGARLPEGNAAPGVHASKPNSPLRLNGPLDRAAVKAPVFCDRWRATPAVQPRTIASGISDMQFEVLNNRQGGDEDLSLVRVWLRWSPDSADGAGEASAFITPGRSSRREP